MLNNFHSRSFFLKNSAARFPEKLLVPNRTNVGRNRDFKDESGWIAKSGSQRMCIYEGIMLTAAAVLIAVPGGIEKPGFVQIKSPAPVLPARGCLL